MPRSTATNRFAQRNVNASLYFNNTTNGGIIVPFNASLSPTVGLGLECWFRPVPKTGGDVSCILFDNTDSGVGNSYLLQVTSAGLLLGYMTSGGVARNLLTATIPVKFNEWNFIGAGYTGSAWNIYLNGAQIATMAATGAMSQSAQALRIGQYYTGTLVPTQGFMSGPRVYARSYTLQDHQDRYYKNLDDATMRTGLVLDMPLVTGAGLTATDVSGSGNNGTFTTPVWNSDSPFKARKLATNANLVKNGYFEYAPPFTAAGTGAGRWIDGTSAGSTTNDLFGWAFLTETGTGSVQFDSSTKNSGSYSIKLSTLATGSLTRISSVLTTGGPDVLNRAIPVAPNTDYNLVYSLKTNYVSGDSNDGAYVLVSFADAAGAGISSVSSTKIKTTTDWTQYSLRFTTPSTCRFIYPRPGIDGTTGTATLIMDAWFDDISLLPVYPEGRVPANGNLVKNFDFEVAPTFVAAQTGLTNRFIDGNATGSTTNATYGWSGICSGTAAIKFDTAVSYSGSNSLKLSTLAVASYAEVYAQSATGGLLSYYGKTLMPVLPSTSYTYSFWMKTAYVSGDSADGAKVAFIESDSAGANASHSTTTSSVKTTTDWTRYTGTFTTVATAAFVQIDPRLYGHTGSATLIMDAWFDDFYLAKTTNPGRIQIT